MAKKDTSIVLVEQVQSKILFLRGEKVIMDSDLAALYGVPTKRLNEQIKRNHERFPPDFMFQLTAEEVDGLRSQIATTNKGSGGRRYKPYAFTEHGAIMAASVLNSERAVQTSIKMKTEIPLRYTQYAIRYTNLYEKAFENENFNQTVLLEF